MTYGDIALLVKAAERTKKDPVVVVQERCNVEAKVARAWITKAKEPSA